MNRRNFIKSLVSLAACSAIPVKIIPGPISDITTKETYDISLGQIMTQAARERSEDITRQVAAENFLFERFM